MSLGLQGSETKMSGLQGSIASPQTSIYQKLAFLSGLHASRDQASGSTLYHKNCASPEFHKDATGNLTYHWPFLESRMKGVGWGIHPGSSSMSSVLSQGKRKCGIRQHLHCPQKARACLALPISPTSPSFSNTFDYPLINAIDVYIFQQLVT